MRLCDKDIEKYLDDGNIIALNSQTTETELISKGISQAIPSTIAIWLRTQWLGN